MILLAALDGVHGAAAPLAEFPFSGRNGLIWVRATSPHSDRPLNFLLDSGAGVSVLNLPTVRSLGLKLGRAVSVRGVSGGVEGYWPEQLAAKAGDVTLPAEYLAVDLGCLGKACHRGVDGLLGTDFFRGRVVEIDFKARMVRLLSGSDPTGASVVLTLKASRQALLVPVGVDGGGPQWVRVDTGCGSALHWVRESGSNTPGKNTLSIGLAEQRLPMTTTTVQVGGVSLPGVPTVLHDSAIFRGESGLLGNGLLSRFERVRIDTRAGQLILYGPQPIR